MRIYRQGKKKSIQESASESNVEEEINPPKCGCGFTENKAMSTPNDSRYVSKRLISPRWDSPSERYIKNDTLVGWCFLFMQTFAAPPRFENLMCIWLVALLAPEYKRNFFFFSPFSSLFFFFFFLAEIAQRIESPMALWLGTVIEKGQLAFSRSGRELTGEIWSWGLPKEKGIWGEISIG